MPDIHQSHLASFVTVDTWCQFWLFRTVQRRMAARTFHDVPGNARTTNASEFKKRHGRMESPVPCMVAERACPTPLPTRGSRVEADPAMHDARGNNMDMLDDVDLTAIFEWIDADHNGTATYDEFLVFAEYCGVRWRQNVLLEAELRFVFDEADADGSGDVTKDEIGHLLARVGLLRPDQGQVSLCVPQKSVGGVRQKLKDGMSTFVASLRSLRRQTRLAIQLMRHERLRGELTPAQRDIVHRSKQELAKLLPFFLVYALPGGSALCAAMVAAFPSMLPLAFQQLFPMGSRRKALSSSEFDALCVQTFASLLSRTRAKLAEERAGRKS